MYTLYSVLVLVVFVIASPWFLYQALRYRKYVGSLGQRMGYLPVSFNIDGDESIWIHAVSVGEVLTARPLIAALRQRYPNLRIFLSTTTMAGQQLARRSVPNVDAVFYFPFDLAVFVRRTLDLVRPRLFLMMETEIWPIRAARVPRPRDQDRGRQRAAVDALVPALPDDPADHATGARRTSIASACKATNRRAASSSSAPIPRRVVVTGIAEVRLAGQFGTAPQRATACCAISGCRPRVR